MCIRDRDTLSLNTIGNLSPHPDEFMLTKSGKKFSASFTTGQMASAYGSTFVPSGWLIPFNYIRTGREISGRAKVRLIDVYKRQGCTFDDCQP